MFAQQFAPSVEPPAGLRVVEVPQFIMLGFDDNPDVDALTWIVAFLAERTNPAGTGQVATFDGAPVRAAFFSNGKYLDDSRELSELHVRVEAAGHEIANHTQNHLEGKAFSVAEWLAEINSCRQVMIKAGLDPRCIVGFRAPYLSYNDAMFAALVEAGIVYDSSIEEGVQDDQTGDQYFWPYRLDRGSPGNLWAAERGWRPEVGSYPGLWEFALHKFEVPDDAACARLGSAPGVQARLFEALWRDSHRDWRTERGKFSGLDWNVLEQAKLGGDDFLAILRHTLALRLAGNRAPLMVGLHTALYPADKPDRRRALESFIVEALAHPEVRIVTPMALVRWLQAPVALGSH